MTGALFVAAGRNEGAAPHAAALEANRVARLQFGRIHPVEAPPGAVRRLPVVAVLPGFRIDIERPPAAIAAPPVSALGHVSDQGEANSSPAREPRETQMM